MSSYTILGLSELVTTNDCNTFDIRYFILRKCLEQGRINLSRGPRHFFSAGPLQPPPPRARIQNSLKSGRLKNINMHTMTVWKIACIVTNSKKLLLSLLLLLLLLPMLFFVQFYFWHFQHRDQVVLSSALIFQETHCLQLKHLRLSCFLFETSTSL